MLYIEELPKENCWDRGFRRVTSKLQCIAFPCCILLGQVQLYFDDRCQTSETTHEDVRHMLTAAKDGTDGFQALETIKKLRKDKAQEVKEFKLKLEHLNTNKNSAHKLRTEVEQSTRRKLELEKQISTLGERLQQLQEVRYSCSMHISF